MRPSVDTVTQSLQQLLAGSEVAESESVGVLGFGVDVVEIDRISKAVERHPQRFAQRVLVRSEWERLELDAEPSRYLAKQFAAKEAVAKALGTGIAQGVTFHQMHVLRDALGAPYVELFGVAARRCQWLGGRCVRLSITDERQWAIAAAVLTS